MILNSINILNFKNIEEAALTFSPKVNCLTGNNGMGKTNVLDAIYYLSFSKSCIHQGDGTVINHDADYMMLQGKYTRKNENEEITMSAQRGKRKTLKRNGKEYKKLSEHIGLIPVVMISPMDWELIRGGGEERRRLMDLIISQSDKEYLNALICYGKAVENRNAMIRQGYRDPILFETVETQIANAGDRIHSVRKNWIKDFTPIFMEYYEAISGSKETVSMSYRSHLNDKPMQALLAESHQRDMAVGFTTVGTHRDDIELLIGGHPMRKTGSQGQCKTYTIALRLAQYEFLRRQSGMSPLLLLDDIFDRLDADRVENIMTVASREQFGQIFITDTNRTHIDKIIRKVGGDYKIFGVENGVISDAEQGGER